MVLSKKVILIFTLLALLTISLNTTFFLLSDIDSVRNTQIQGMQVISNRMIKEIEQYVVIDGLCTRGDDLKSQLHESPK